MSDRWRCWLNDLRCAVGTAYCGLSKETDKSNCRNSEGFPRHVSSPDIFTEIFSAAVDFLGLQEYIDREKIGTIGICGSGGFTLSAAQYDTRINAVATMSMFDMSTAVRVGMDKKSIQEKKERLSQQR